MRDSKYQKGLEDLIQYINSFSDTKDMILVEIGSYAGESTVSFAENFKKIIAIDPFLNDYDVNDITCQHMDLDKVYDVFKNRTS